MSGRARLNKQVLSYWVVYCLVLHPSCVTNTNSRLIPKQTKVTTINILHDSLQPQQKPNYFWSPFPDLPLKFIDKVSWPSSLWDPPSSLNAINSDSVWRKWVAHHPGWLVSLVESEQLYYWDQYQPVISWSSVSPLGPVTCPVWTVIMSLSQGYFGTRF